MPDLPDGLRDRLPDGDRLRDRIRERSDDTGFEDGDDVGSRDAFDHKGGDLTNDVMKHADAFKVTSQVGAAERDAFDHKGGDTPNDYIKQADAFKVGAAEPDAFDHKADDMSWKVEEGDAWKVEEAEIQMTGDDPAPDLFVVHDVMDDPAAGLAPLDDGDGYQALPELDASVLDDSMLGDDDGIDGF